ncbi:uncharacterized protein LOC132661685 isoform X2 [Panthera onca]
MRGVSAPFPFQIFASAAAQSDRAASRVFRQRLVGAVESPRELSSSWNLLTGWPGHWCEDRSPRCRGAQGAGKSVAARVSVMFPFSEVCSCRPEEI